MNVEGVVQNATGVRMDKIKPSNAKFVTVSVEQ